MPTTWYIVPIVAIVDIVTHRKQVGTITEDHAHQDIDAAIAVG